MLMPLPEHYQDWKQWARDLTKFIEQDKAAPTEQLQSILESEQASEVEAGRIAYISDQGILRYTDGTNWLDIAVGLGLTDGDKGDITVTGSGATWTIDNNAVSGAKLRDSIARSVIGRSANSTGDPADIQSGGNGQILAELSSALGFQTLTALLDVLGATQGQVLYRNATVWTVLAAGTAGQALLTGGAGANPSWGSVGKNMTWQIFTGSGTWTKPTGCTLVIVIVTGSGGGGGGSDNANGVAASGGAGATAIARVDVTAISSRTVTIGTAGSGGSNTGGNGTAGGASSWGTEAVAGGGGLGTGCSSASNPAGGAGGTASAGDIQITGGDGSNGIWISAVNLHAIGQGGASIWGGGGRTRSNDDGRAGQAYGSGGAGGASNSATGRLGGAGKAGICVVLEFYGS